jgi:hypothetical protein
VASRANIISRSRLMPGKVMTADFINNLPRFILWLTIQLNVSNFDLIAIIECSTEVQVEK